MKVVLFAMTSKGYAVLNAFLESSRGLVAFVVGARDSAIDDDYYEQIQNICSEHEIPFYSRGNHPKITSEHAVLAVSWRWIIDSVGAPIIVFHDSILPRCRGFNPLVTSLLNGDRKELHIVDCILRQQHHTSSHTQRTSRLHNVPVK